MLGFQQKAPVRRKMPKVDFIKFDEIKKYAAKASKDGVSVKHTPSTIWFGIWDEGQLVGFGGLILKLPKARIKGDWVFPEHRGKGYGQLLTEFRLSVCKKNSNIKVLEAYSLHPHYYKDILGWKIRGQYKPNTWIVELKL
jgi:GNAT superfamily N-acetyltransferase